MLGIILLIVLFIILVGALPAWPYSRGYGYYPSGVTAILLIVLIILLWRGYI